MYFKNILVPFDGSKFSKKAINVATDLAKKYKSKLTIINCIEEFYVGRWYRDNRIEEELFAKEYNTIKNELKKIKQNAQEQGVPVKIKIIKALDVTKKITDYSKKNRIDLILMGSHGRTGWNRLFLGSKSENILKSASCPVLIIK
ncbi:universal stress protein [Nitrosopumilus sp. S4]